jgi:hypothetical protein
MNILERINAGEFRNKLPLPPLDRNKQETSQLWDAYLKEKNRLIGVFENALQEEHGMKGHPKAGLLFYKAWDKGHSSGHYEVALAYADLLELVK